MCKTFLNLIQSNGAQLHNYLVVFFSLNFLILISIISHYMISSIESSYCVCFIFLLFHVIMESLNENRMIRDIWPKF